MPYMHQYDYLFAFGIIFAGLDAFMIGANDVANSFATSVSSRSLTMGQAVIAASICEFAGAVLVGARVADTIKNGIIKSSVFRGSPDMQMLSFVVALVASSVWLTIATKYSWPVSTTYSIISAVVGVGVAAGGIESVNWGWNGGKGLATIFAGWFIAPGIAAGFGAIGYLMVKFSVLVRKDPTKWGMLISPIIFFTVACVLTLSIVYKGAPSLGLTKMSEASTAAAVVGTGAVVALLSSLFWLPYVHAKIIKKDYTLRWFHFFLGPALWWRPAPPPVEDAMAHVPDYRILRETEDDQRKAAEKAAANGTATTASQSIDGNSEKNAADLEDGNAAPAPSALHQTVEKKDPHPIEGAWAEPKNLLIIARYKAIPFIVNIFTHGIKYDIHAKQAGDANTAEGKRMLDIYRRSKQYPNETEHLFSFLQVLTACTASFAHGANDVSNAIGPFSVIYHVWSTATLSSSKTPVPVWILAFGGAMISLGLATYGYNIMAVLGNRITLHSPSRGFSMELGAAITVILASQYGLPVSTTMCITGATLGVALMNGDLRATNWRALGWIFLGWVLTVPIVATLSGCVLGIIINAPRF